LCQQGLAAATDDETRAFFLRYDAETYMEERSPQCEPVLKQVIEQYAGTTQVSWAKMDLGEAYVHAALVIGNTGNYTAQAMTTLTDFINNNPTHEKIARAYWWRAGLEERQGNYQAALTDYQKAADLYPTYPNGNECLMGAIKMLQKFERWDDAITYAQRYIQLLPQFNPAAAQLTIGFSYAGKGDLVGAITQFDKVVTQYPAAKDDCAKALFQKGLSQKALGQVAAAVQTFQQLKHDYPDNVLAAQAQQQLDALGQ
jgi:TolA-binding protein